MFKQTKNNSNLLQEYIAIKDKLNIDWSNVTWPDLRQPINSALAVTLLLKLKNFRLVPENLELQATIWQSLNPARNQAFRFVSQEYDKTVGMLAISSIIKHSTRYHKQNVCIGDVEIYGRMNSIFNLYFTCICKYLFHIKIAIHPIVSSNIMLGYSCPIETYTF